MPKTGQNPSPTYNLTEFEGGAPRLRPPDTLGDRERAVFVDLVAGCDPKHFRAADLTLLCRYCEAVVLAEQAAGELTAGGVVIESDKGPKVSPWFAIHKEAVKTMAMLALRLRLGPQSRQPRAAKVEIRATSYYDRIQLLEGPRETIEAGDGDDGVNPG
jgi:P27 family predicted phage terminase small subunit